MNVSNTVLRFCKNIADLRKKHRFSHREMAEILHISEKSVILLEQGVVPRDVTAVTVIYAAAYFKISANELLDT